MHRRALILVSLLLALALPLSASQFREVAFDDLARESTYIVRGHVIDTWAAWDDAHEVIYTYATLRVQRYFGEIAGPDTLVVREVGGTVDGYTQQAIGFPVIRRNEQVVLFLTEWEGSSDYRIHAYNQGKYLVNVRAGRGEVLSADPVQQGDAEISREQRLMRSEGAALGIEEFAAMVDAARAGRPSADAHQARD